MKKIYFNLTLIALCLFVLTSCSSRYRFVTKGLSETDSSYLITKAGKRIDANEIVVKPRKLKVDGQTYPIGDLSVIKSKKMYFVIHDGKLYLTEMYGKINLLYTLSYTTTYSTSNYAAGSGMSGMNNMSTTNVTKSYYLQKQGSATVDRLTRGTFLDYVSDNPDALAKAKAHYTWQYTTYVSFVAGAASMIYLVKSVDSNSTFSSLQKPLGALVGSFVLHGVLSSIADHKLHKAIEIYNTASE
jgi:hypothetical protein